MSGINLQKNQGINLTKTVPGLSRVRLGLGWPQTNHDLDVVVFINKNENGRPVLVSNNHMIFYNNLSDPTQAVVHSGDNLVGGSDDAEVVTVDLAKLSALTPEAVELSVIVSIHDAKARGHNFSQIQESHISIYNDETGDIIARYDLDETFTSGETSVQFGSLLKNAQGEWTFNAVGQGHARALSDFVVFYGATVA